MATAYWSLAAAVCCTVRWNVTVPTTPPVAYNTHGPYCMPTAIVLPCAVYAYSMILPQTPVIFWHDGSLAITDTFVCTCAVVCFSPASRGWRCTLGTFCRQTVQQEEAANDQHAAAGNTPTAYRGVASLLSTSCNNLYLCISMAFWPPYWGCRDDQYNVIDFCPTLSKFAVLLCRRCP